MNKLKEIFKQITDKLSRTIRLSPTELERKILLTKIEAVSDHVDAVALELEKRLLALEQKPDKSKVNKKDIKNQ